MSEIQNIHSTLSKTRDVWSYDHPSMGFKNAKLYYGFSLLLKEKHLITHIERLRDKLGDKATNYSLVGMINPTVRGVIVDGKDIIHDKDFLNKRMWVKDPIDDSVNFISYNVFKEIETQTVKHVDPGELFFKIMEVMKRYIYFTHEEHYVIYTLHIINIMCYRLYNYCPIVHFFANFGSGKTVAGKFAEYICSGFYTVGITKSAFMRSLDRRRSVVIADEKENIMEESDNLPLILNGCFSRGSQTALSIIGENNDWKATTFSLYCPVILCSITPIYGATADRCIRFDMVRAKEVEISGNITKDSKLPLWAEMRDDISRFWMQNYKPVYDNYMAFKLDDKQINNRVLDLWLPILSLSDYISKHSKKFKDKKYQDMLTKYIGTVYIEMKVDNISSDYTYILISILDEMEHGEEIKSSVIFNIFKAKVQAIDDHDRKVSIKLMGGLMRKIGYSFLDKTKIERSDGMYYLVSHTKNNDYTQRYYYRELTGESDKIKSKIVDSAKKVMDW